MRVGSGSSMSKPLKMVVNCGIMTNMKNAISNIPPQITIAG